VRDWARAERDRPTPHRFAARIYEDMGAIPLAAEAAERAARCAPGDASAWERLGRLRLAQLDGAGALAPLERARMIQPSVEGLLDLALAHHLTGDLGGEASACHEATLVDSASPIAWSRYAHALARTDRVSDCLTACERALELGEDNEVRELLARMRAVVPRVLPEQTAA
jgi:tetratricopeptide (TPR) repeat protein